MSSVVCSECGRVRLNSSESCPACGAPPAAVTAPKTSLARSSGPPRRSGVIETSGREIPNRVADFRAELRRHRRLAAALLAGAVALVVLVYLFVSSSGGTVVLIPQGSSVSVGQDGSWAFNRGGTVQGSFVVTNGSAEVCLANYDMFDYAWSHGLSFDQCPSNATFSSGFVTSGSVTAGFGPGLVYLWTFAPVGWTQGQPLPLVTWTSPLVISAS